MGSELHVPVLPALLRPKGVYLPRLLLAELASNAIARACREDENGRATERSS